MSTSDTSHETGLEVAVIGLSGRFPGAADIDAFWENLRAGVDSILHFSDDELVAEGIDPRLLADPRCIKARGVLRDIELFDAKFFNYSPREAEVLDPQQRLFLECAWEALETAGYADDAHAGSVGVFGSSTFNTYLRNNISHSGEHLQGLDPSLIKHGNEKDHLATRVAYKLNLKGPAVTVQTACSSSLVAVHLACQSLLSGESDMALAGGVSASAAQKSVGWYQEGGMHSQDGRCRAFDALAGGTVFGSGLGIVVLKRLADAVADRDRIYAVVKGSATNNDGAVKVGYTAPSIDGQADVIVRALTAAEVDPATVDYVEAHGTGTKLGDPIEISALTQAFRQWTSANSFCAIGSVKTNVGHLDAAAGVTGFIKATLALHNKQLPPSLYFEKPNPAIDFEKTPFYVNAALNDWPQTSHPRRAAVSSFGIGGTNAHVVLEEAPPIEAVTESRPQHLLLLSARTESALDVMTTNLVEHLRNDPEPQLADIAYTLHVGRKHFAHRRMAVCRDVEDAVQALEQNQPARVLTAVHDPATRAVAFSSRGRGRSVSIWAAGSIKASRAFERRSILAPESWSRYSSVTCGACSIRDPNRPPMPPKS